MNSSCGFRGPSSRNPSFNRPAIERRSERLGIHNRFEGEALGGDPDDGRELSVIAKTISRIASAAALENVAVMCAEGDLAKCHRAWDVAVHLMASHEVAPISIPRDGSEERATQSLLRVSKRDLPDHASPTPQWSAIIVIRDSIVPIRHDI